MDVKGVTIRISKEMLEKTGYVADYEGRSINSHILVLIRNDIENFEKKHGIIEGQVPPEINVKPTKNK